MTCIKSVKFCSRPSEVKARLSGAVFHEYLDNCRIVKHLGQSTIKEVDRRKIAERPHRDRVGTAEIDS
jgi:hypothetical protein